MSPLEAKALIRHELAKLAGFEGECLEAARVHYAGGRFAHASSWIRRHYFELELELRLAEKTIEAYEALTEQHALFGSLKKDTQDP